MLMHECLSDSLGDGTMHSKTGDDKRKQGVVKWYSERLGYGFAEVEGEVDEVFIHRTALAQFGLTRLLAEDIVKVTVTDSPRGRIVDVLYGAERLPVDERLIGTAPEADEHFARVKFFNALRGYGFIEVEGYDQDIFVHSRIIERNGLPTIYQGQRLLVSVEEGDKSWQVRTIRLLAGADGEMPWAQRQAEAAADAGGARQIGGETGKVGAGAKSTGSAMGDEASAHMAETTHANTSNATPASTDDSPSPSTDGNVPISNTADGETDADDSAGSETDASEDASSEIDAGEDGGEK